jgi:hypothetical protein
MVYNDRALDSDEHADPVQMGATAGGAEAAAAVLQASAAALRCQVGKIPIISGYRAQAALAALRLGDIQIDLHIIPPLAG